MNLPVRTPRTLLLLLCAALVLAAGCRASSDDTEDGTHHQQTVPQEGDWGIYALDLASQDVELIWSGNDTITCRCLNHAGDVLAFSQKAGGTADSNEEIFAIGVDGTGLRRLTDNSYRDLFPSYSPDDSRMAFLTIRSSTLDIFVMDAGGGNQRLLYDSGFHDSDINWGSGGRIAFTRNSQIWTMNEDGSDPRQVTSPPRAGEPGKANLPFGDYDPNFSPDGSRIAFERLEGDTSVHGNYNLFLIDASGAGETRLTDTGYSQGLPVWSHSGDRLVYVVAAVGSEGKYDIHMIDADGANDRNITPDYFPARFLCHSALFSRDDTKVYLAGQWYS